MKKVLCLFVLVMACGDGGKSGGLFDPKPECTGEAIEPYAGTFPQVISQLAIGSAADGIDLDRDGQPDNKLAAAAAIAKDAIAAALKDYSIMIPLEFFDMPTVEPDSCVKFAVYIGAFARDRDGDGVRPGIENGDCNDNDAAIHPGQAEVPGDGRDNDCDGLADEDSLNTANATDAADMDGDGISVANGDCDDHNASVKPGASEVCNDGLDNDCDGVADRSVDTSGNVTACNPFDPAMPQDIPIDPISFGNDGAPEIAFTSGAIGDGNRLEAGPSLFQVSIPLTEAVSLDLQLTGATIQGDVQADGTIQNGKLGGVIDAQTAQGIKGISVPQVLLPEDSLLDVVFANLLAPLLGLPAAPAAVVAKYPNCRTPDIDVDGDGLEAFCDSTPGDSQRKVDVCIDGDGTEIFDTPEMDCTEAMKDGQRRFVDGISVAVTFSTTRAKSLIPPK